MHHHALALLHPQRFSKAKHLAIDCRHVINGVHEAVVAALKMSAPVMQGEEDLNVIVPWMIAGLNQQKSMLTTVLRLRQVFAGKGVSVKPAKSRRVGFQRISNRGPRRDHRRSLLHRSVDLRRKNKSMPV